MAARAGRKELADGLTRALHERAGKSEGMVWWTSAGFSRWGDDRNETTAVALKALVAHDPEVYRLFYGVIANPGAWSHYSYAIRDAMELFTVPLVEVHLSNVDEREEWRRQSVLEGLPTARVVGKGAKGYREALELLVRTARNGE